MSENKMYEAHGTKIPRWQQKMQSKIKCFKKKTFLSSSKAKCRLIKNLDIAVGQKGCDDVHWGMEQKGKMDRKKI